MNTSPVPLILVQISQKRAHDQSLIDDACMFARLHRKENKTFEDHLAMAIIFFREGVCDCDLLEIALAHPFVH